MPRFVILQHDHPELHWDLMLECGPVLKTWRLEKAPAANGAAIRAVKLPDHRLFYLDYEGPVSGDRGTVRRWDSGEYEGELLENGWSIRVTGKKLQAMLVLETKVSGPFSACIFCHEAV